MKPMTQPELIEWLVKMLVYSAIVRKNIAIGWGEVQLREVK